MQGRQSVRETARLQGWQSSKEGLGLNDDNHLRRAHERREDKSLI